MRTKIISILALFTIFQLQAQQSMNMNLLSSFSYSNSLSDVWGYATDEGEYALVGLYDGISILDVTNPTSANDLQVLLS